MFANLLPYCTGIFQTVERARRLRPKPETGAGLKMSGLPQKGAGRMKTAGTGTIKGIAARLGSRIAPNRNPEVSAREIMPVSRLTSTGVSAREYVLRRVASGSVASRRVELQSVSSRCVSRRVSPAPQPVLSSPRLALAHVFACLKAAAAKSRVSRLLGRTARGKRSASSSASVSSRASVPPASVSSMSPAASVPRPRLH